MEVLLLERVGRLGGLGDKVTVRDGYARNYLLPQKKALRATAANEELFAKQKEQLDAENARKKAEAEKAAGGMTDASVVLIRQAGESGQLYGAVNSRDIAEALTAHGHKVSRQQVVIDTPIKTLGLHHCTVVLQAEVSVPVTVNVAMSEDEAESQRKAALQESTVAVEQEEEAV